jgi:hypothetical protein
MDALLFPRLEFQKESKVAWSEIWRIRWPGDGWNLVPRQKEGVTGHSAIVQELIVSPWPTAAACSTEQHTVESYAVTGSSYLGTL